MTTNDMQDMAFGICIPNFRAGTDPETMLAATQTAERLGWHSALATDHILVDSAPRGNDYRHIYEALTSIAWLAGQTTTVRLGMSVLVAPMRNAVVMAKELATIDALSDGRLIAGIGIGWNRTEFESVGEGERFGHRGAWLEETVALWRHLWAGETGPYEGRYNGWQEGYFSPLPPQGARQVGGGDEDGLGIPTSQQDLAQSPFGLVNLSGREASRAEVAQRLDEEVLVV